MGNYDDLKTHAPYYPPRVTDAYNKLVATCAALSQTYNSQYASSHHNAAAALWRVLLWVMRANENKVKSSIQYFQDEVQPWLDAPAALEAISKDYLTTYQSVLKLSGELNIKDGRWGDPAGWSGPGQEAYADAAVAQRASAKGAADHGEALSDATFGAAIDSLNSAIVGFELVGDLMAKLAAMIGGVGGNPAALLSAAKDFGALIEAFTSLFVKLAAAYLALCVETKQRVRQIQQGKDAPLEASGGRWAVPGMWHTDKWDDGSPGRDSEAQIVVNASYFQRHRIRWSTLANTLNQTAMLHSRSFAAIDPKSFQWKHLQELKQDLTTEDAEFQQRLGQGVRALGAVQEGLATAQALYLETETGNAEEARRLQRTIDDTVRA